MTHSGRWTPQEHSRFLSGLERHGRCWKKVAAVVRTRTREQCRVHYQKYELREAKTKNPEPESYEDEVVLVPPSTPPQKVVKSRVPRKDAVPGATYNNHNRTNRGPWSDQEHSLFLECWSKYGRSWTKLAQVITTRTNEQIRTHAQKYFSKLQQLRSLGYHGQYSMNGRRHLTKSFVKSTQQQGTASPSDKKGQSSRPSPFEAMSYSELKALATEKGLLPRPINKRVITRDYLVIILEQSGLPGSSSSPNERKNKSRSSTTSSSGDEDDDDDDEAEEEVEEDDMDMMDEEADGDSMGDMSSDDAEEIADQWEGEGAMDADDDRMDEEEEEDDDDVGSLYISGPWAMMMENKGRRWRSGPQGGDGAVTPGRRPSFSEGKRRFHCSNREEDNASSSSSSSTSSCFLKPEDDENPDEDVNGGDDTTFFAKLLLGIKGVKELPDDYPSSNDSETVVKEEDDMEDEEDDTKPACEALCAVAAAARIKEKEEAARIERDEVAAVEA